MGLVAGVGVGGCPQVKCTVNNDNCVYSTPIPLITTRCVSTSLLVHQLFVCVRTCVMRARARVCVCVCVCVRLCV